MRNLTSYYGRLLTPGSYLERVTAYFGYGFNAETGRSEGILLDTQGVTAVDNQQPLHQKTVLIQIRSATQVSFETADPGWVTLKVLDLLDGKFGRWCMQGWPPDYIQCSGTDATKPGVRWRPDFICTGWRRSASY